MLICWIRDTRLSQSHNINHDKWYGKPLANQTWINFKDHIEDAHAAIGIVHGFTMNVQYFGSKQMSYGNLWGVREDGRNISKEVWAL